MFHVLAQSVIASGLTGQAAALFRRAIDIDKKIDDQSKNMGVSLYNLSNTLRYSGALQESEVTARQAKPLSNAEYLIDCTN